MNFPDSSKFLFIHVMKTGGTSFAEILRCNFRREERYPDAALAPGSDIVRSMEAYSHVPRLVREVNARSDILRIVRGHVPYAVRSLLNAEYEALTLLRHPVERTLSYLKHCRRYHAEHGQMDLEAIYEQPWFFESFMHDYQTKIFSMTPEESMAERRFGDLSPGLPPRCEFVDGEELPETAQQLLRTSPARLTLELFSPSTGVVNVDQNRLQAALDNLRKVSLVGVTDRYEAFIHALHTRYGWKIDSIPVRNAADTTVIAPRFRSRIEQDNRWDMDLYELARELVV